jgi:hypothetical protein
MPTGITVFTSPKRLNSEDSSLDTSTGRVLGALMTGLGWYYFWAGVAQDRHFQYMSVYGRLLFAGMGLFGVHEGWVHPAWKMGFIFDVFGALLTRYILARQY